LKIFSPKMPPSDDPAEEFEEAPYIAEAGAPDELEEAMAWLDELATQQVAPVEAEPAMPVAEIEPWADVEPEPATSLEGELEEEPAALPVSEEPTPEAMVVPDVAMMYLDSLVEHGGASETAGEPAAAFAEEIPDDLDGMMAWLEQLSSGAEPQLSEPASAEWDDTLEAADEAQMAEPASALEEEEPSLAFDEEAEPELEMTDLSWLPEEPAEELALEPPELEPEGAVDFGEVPEDPDEVMAWLEQLAARQGAPLDELPTVDEVSDEVETPDWLAADLAEAEGEVWPAAAEETGSAGGNAERRRRRRRLAGRSAGCCRRGRERRRSRLVGRRNGPRMAGRGNQGRAVRRARVAGGYAGCRGTGTGDHGRGTRSCRSRGR
jgi:hypothetical protein